MSRLIRAVRDGYYELQNRLDPMERVFKRMRHAGPMRVHFSSSLTEPEAEARLKSLLAGQRNRHGAWMIFDGLLALGTLPLAPFLVPIPGPNVFFYYPAPEDLQSLVGLARSPGRVQAHAPATGGSGRDRQSGKRDWPQWNHR